jgi:hypothetical protein
LLSRLNLGGDALEALKSRIKRFFRGFAPPHFIRQDFFRGRRSRWD